MSILRRQMSRLGARPLLVVFISISLSAKHRNALFDIAVHDLGARADGKVLVVPCDELGVLPRHKERAETARGLPAVFLGISGALRRALESHYECRPHQIRRDPELRRLRERLEDVETDLLEAKRNYSTLLQRNLDLPDAEDRFAGLQTSMDRLADRYRAAFDEYHAALMSKL